MTTYVFDLDGTLCTTVSGGDYRAASPFRDRIAIVNKLYEEGNTIKISTARGMGRSGDSVGFADENFYELTEEQLEKWGVKYHNLMMGKPSADYYIDDKAVRADEFFDS